MRRFTSLRRPVLVILALCFAAATTLYSIVWMVHISRAPLGVGVEFEMSPTSHQTVVTRVYPDGPAEAAGVRTGDVIVAIDGRKMSDPSPFYGYAYVKSVQLGKQGDVAVLSVERQGAPELLTFRILLKPFRPRPAELSGWQDILGKVLSFYPLFLLIVGVAVLFLRLDDADAWRLALMFGGFIAAAPLVEGSIPPHLRPFVAWYHMTAWGMSPAVFNYFFSVFPAPSPIERKFPWLKKVYLGIMGAWSIPLGLACLVAGDMTPAYSIYGWWAPNLAADIVYALAFSAYILGFVSLVWNSVRPPTAEARRKTRVIVWGTLIGYGPIFLIYFFQRVAKLQPGTGLPWALAVISLALMPLSYAYAVVRHRVLEIPVLFKRSARYVLVQRGFVVLTALITTAAILVFIAVFTRLLQGHSDTALRVGMGLGIAFGGISAVINLHVLPRVTKRIDQAFFRSAYDARLIMESLARKTRSTASREDLAMLLEVEIREALHPASLVVYLEDKDGRLRTYANGASPTPASGQGSGATVPPTGSDDAAGNATRVDDGDRPPQSLPADAPLLAELARRGGPWDVSASVIDGLAADRVLAPMRAECLVPLLGRGGELTGLLVLGPRLSEEPYSREDKRLLASVAAQAAVALENVRLAEGMAESMEAERRAAQEIEIARQVQARLFPQKHPPLKTLEYAGGCTQARQVGGDYYDFLDLGPGRLGLVLADIAGKGISGALLMANLQANLRSQYAVALDDLPRLLQSVNRLFYENTADNSYATLFFGDYDDRTRRLRYANCGHLPPLLLRADGSVARLEATSTVLGLFETWSCSVEETFLVAGDSLVLYTDGVTEAARADGEEFGEARLIQTVCAQRSLPVADLLTAIVSAVREFSGPEQADDITLVVAKCHS